MEELEYQPDAYYADPEMANSEEFVWGARKVLVNGAAMPGAELTFALVWVLPGQEDPLHQHPNAEMVGHIIAGECEFQVGDTMYHLVPGDSIRVPRGVPHQACCTGWEPLRMIVAQSSPAVETIPVTE
jgi:quercetin dioxygenase-like cupin family protein